jgi:hypothetical protein
MITSTLAMKPRDVLARKIFGGSPTGTVEAFPLWKPVLPPANRPDQNLFAIASGAEVSLTVELPVDSMVRLLWGRFSAFIRSANRYWSSLSQANVDDVEDLREDNDYLRWLEIRLVLNSAAGVETIEWTPLSTLQGADEFGRVRLPYLLGRQATVTVELRNTLDQTLYVAGFLHGWRIKL